jgi:asparagine synthase (glutamine-hydrolysing)
MCGILGLIDPEKINENLLLRMRDTMVHRGPDDSGVWISRDKRVGLGHRRLSIIDLSEMGRQPMSDNDQKIWITFNGEIYNFPEIRDNLEKKGYVFQSRTDTEVILNAYKEWGKDCVQRLNGMFAFGIYDDAERILFLARDRVGKKPLYYWYDSREKKFAFASEIKALAVNAQVSKQLDPEALNQYLTFGYIPGDQSIFKDIRKLRPAHAMIYEIDKDSLYSWDYWSPPQQSETALSENELSDQLEMLLRDAVGMRMISDVPLGAFLSGGVDSSLVVAIMSQLSDKPVKTFSIGFDNCKYNELPYAKIVAEYFNTDHHEIIVQPDAFSVLPDIVRHFDEPFADSSMIPTYYVSRATRDYVTVALSGDGGDEIFGGYQLYLYSKYYEYVRTFVPSFVRKPLSFTASFLPEKFPGKRQLARAGSDLFDAIVELSNHLFFQEKSRRKLLNRDVHAAIKGRFGIAELRRKEYMKERESSLLNRVTYADFMTYLPDDILVKVDRASMMVSLEVRAPLLDYRIAELSFGLIADDLKIRRHEKKYILKKLARKILPASLNIQRKWGFAIPVSDWFRGPLSSQISEILMGDDCRLFDRRYIRQLLDEHMAGLDHSSRLYSLLVFYLWKREYPGLDL